VHTELNALAKSMSIQTDLPLFNASVHSLSVSKKLLAVDLRRIIPYKDHGDLHFYIAGNNEITVFYAGVLNGITRDLITGTFLSIIKVFVNNYCPHLGRTEQ